jgi:hypothetical protein
MAWRGVAWHGVVWCGMAWCGEARQGKGVDGGGGGESGSKGAHDWCTGLFPSPAHNPALQVLPLSRQPTKDQLKAS